MLPEQLANLYVRRCLSLFSVRDFESSMKKMGVRANATECEFFLDTHPSIFALTNGMYITRAGIFTNQYFSIKPTKKELAQKVLVPGHRCMPFADPEELPQFLNFFYNGKKLDKRVVEFDSGTAENFFFLAGEEFSPQFIVSDPANKGMVLSDNEAVLPPLVNLTSVDISQIIDETDFKYGDRFLCRVTNWDEKEIEITPLVRTSAQKMQIRAEDLGRQSWNDNLENLLLENFQRAGPCNGIEEQLALVFLENVQSLCVADCGSVEECILHSAKIGLEQYGIETRLWKKGESVPAIGNWNNFYVEQEDDKFVGELFSKEDFYVANFLLDAFIKNEFAQKNYDLDVVLKKLIPDTSVFTDNALRQIKNRIHSRYSVIEKTYNRFADFSLVDIRSLALDLFQNVNELIFKIDYAATDLQDYPQQELVTVSQIYSHVLHIIEHLELHPDAALEEKDELMMSIDGMKYNYDCIHDSINNIIKKSF